MGKPLRQVLQTLDDRSRGRPDTRARDTAPPGNDPTSIKNSNRTAFTGFESIWNYIYWQTLAINEFDSISHYLRILIVLGSECAPYANAEMVRDKEFRERCSSHLGPYQPGITHPDPTEDGGADQLGPRKQKAGEKRGAGDPEATPEPGQRDPSKPQIVLPPGLQEVQNQGAADAKKPPTEAGTPAQPAPDQLLDFLLGP
jgi:hypothetical protein